MSNTNGQFDPGAPYAFISGGFVIMPYQGVVESLEANAAQQGKANLKLGPLFRKVADDFREFNRRAEPGWLFQAPEVDLRIIRLAAAAPFATSLSKEAKDRANAIVEPGADRLKIVTE